MKTEAYAKKHDIPGPGTYEDQLAMDKEGSYISSLYTNSKATRVGIDPRFKTVDREKSPGPGTYEENGQISRGYQPCSSFPSTLIKNFKTTEKRPEWHARFKTPGPGTYRPPSDFGYLDLQSRMKEMDGSVFNFSMSMHGSNRMQSVEIHTPAEKSIQSE